MLDRLASLSCHLLCVYVLTLYRNFQGAFAKRRSNFQGPVTTAVARDVASGAPIRGRPYNAGRMANTNQSRSRLLDNSLIICLITWAPLYAILLSLR